MDVSLASVIPLGPRMLPAMSPLANARASQELADCGVTNAWKSISGFPLQDAKVSGDFPELVIFFNLNVSYFENVRFYPRM